MQKLMKRKMHYETIMPVEAYDCEEQDDDWETEIGIALAATGIGVEAAVLLGFVSGPVGATIGIGLGAAAITNAAVHNEELMETVGEGSALQAQANVAMANEIVNTVNDIGNAAGDAVMDFVSNIDQNDPMVQLYGE